MIPHIEPVSIHRQLGIAYARAGYQFQEALDDRRQRLATGESPDAILQQLRQKGGDSNHGESENAREKRR